ncbi:MAG: FAD-binding oxidoreductase [Sphingomonadaceae bacterium]|nr:FAD-binding oxidoreductase [Sphingomonadaceae bacterium]
MAQSGLIEKFAAIVGDKGLTTDPGDMAPWLTDWRRRVKADALAIVAPAHRGEVKAVVEFAAAHRVAIVPQGGNTGMVAGAVPRPGERPIILSTRRLDTIGEVDVQDNSVTVGAGAILSNVHRAAEAAERRFPLSLGAKDSATVGGLIATNAGGTQVLRFGSMRALTLGVEAVLPDGSLFEGLSTLRKDNRGYDLRQLLAGSEGTLGIITAASLRLFPAAPHRLAAWIGLDSTSDALTLLRHLEGVHGDALEGFELVPRDALAIVLEHIPGTRPPLEKQHRWNVLVELRSPGDIEAMQAMFERALAEALAAGLIGDAAVAASEAQAEAFWKLRDSISEAERHDGEATKHDVSVPVSAMPRFIDETTKAVEAEFAGARVIAFGHLGDGNVHFNVRGPAGADSDRWFIERGGAVSAFVHDRVRAIGGSLSAEHGIGQLKIAEFARLADPARLTALRAIKQALDPLDIMNPGKLVPLAEPDRNP